MIPREKDIVSGKRDYYFAEATKVAAFMGMSIHAFFIGFFFYVGVIELALYNIFSALFFLTWFLILRSKMNWVMAFVLFGGAEVFFHAGLATYYVGPASGFSWLIWVIPPLIILNKRFPIWLLAVASVAVAAIYLFIQEASVFQSPVYSLEQESLRISYYMCFFGMVSTDLAITFYFRKIVQQKEKIILREIHHRIKNNLQIVSSIANIRGREKSNREVDEIVNQLRTDVSYLSTMHNQISIDRENITINFTNYINNSLAQGVEFVNDFDFQKMKEPLKLELDIAIPLGMIVSQVIESFYIIGGEKSASSIIGASTNHTGNEVNFKMELKNPDIKENEFSNLMEVRADIAAILADQLEATMNCKSENGTAISEIKFNLA